MSNAQGNAYNTMALPASNRLPLNRGTQSEYTLKGYVVAYVEYIGILHSKTFMLLSNYFSSKPIIIGKMNA